MHEGFQLHAERQIGFQDARQQLLANLRQPFGPARLLHLEAVSFHRQLRRALDVFDVHKTPAFELRAVAQVGIFGQRFMLPAARIVNHGAAQNARRAVEVEKQPRATARAVLQHEMGVQQHGLHLRQNIELAIEISPARLHDAYFGIGEKMHRALQEIGGRNEIRVEDGNQFAGGGLQPFLQGAGFVAMPVCAMVVLDRKASRGIFVAQSLR